MCVCGFIDLLLLIVAYNDRINEISGHSYIYIYTTWPKMIIGLPGTLCIPGRKASGNDV